MVLQHLSEGPSTTNTMACPSCRETIMADAKSCRFCGLPIDGETARRQNARQQAVNSLISQANVIKFSHVLAVLSAAVLVLWTFDSIRSRKFLAAWFAPPLALAVCLNWLRRAGKSGDESEDLREAIAGVRRASWWWLGAVVVEIGLLAIKVFR